MASNPPVRYLGLSEGVYDVFTRDGGERVGMVFTEGARRWLVYPGGTVYPTRGEAARAALAASGHASISAPTERTGER